MSPTKDVPLRFWSTAAALAILLVGTSQPAHAAPKKRFAVLEFNGPESVTVDVLALLSDEARSGALSVLPQDKYVLMTRESMLSMLKDMGKTDCQEGACEVETLQNIGADYGITGRVVSVDSNLFVTLKLFETRTGGLLGAEKVRGASSTELIELVAAAAAKLVQGAPVMGGSQPAPAPATVVEPPVQHVPAFLPPPTAAPETVHKVRKLWVVLGLVGAALPVLPFFASAVLLFYSTILFFTVLWLASVTTTPATTSLYALIPGTACLLTGVAAVSFAALGITGAAVAGRGFMGDEEPVPLVGAGK